MGFFDFLEKPIFNSRFKYPIHLTQVILVILAFALTVPRLFVTNVPRTRAGTYALGMSAKTLILLAYLILSERHRKFKRFHSYKAHLIISCLEVVFWSVVFGLMFSTNVSYCKGVTCALGWIVVILAVCMVVSDLIVTGICIKEFRAWKRAGRPKNFDVAAHENGRRSAWDEEYHQTMPAPMQQHPAPVQQQPKEPAVRAAETAYFQTEPRSYSQRSHGRRTSDSHAPRSPRSPREHRPRRSRERRRSHEERYMGRGEAPRYQGYQEYAPGDARQ